MHKDTNNPPHIKARKKILKMKVVVARQAKRLRISVGELSLEPSRSVVSLKYRNSMVNQDLEPRVHIVNCTYYTQS